MRIAYLDVFFGISGDMTLGALVDAGIEPERLVAELSKLKVGGWQLQFEPVIVHALGATRATVTRPHQHSHHHHHDAGHHHDVDHHHYDQRRHLHDDQHQHRVDEDHHEHDSRNHHSHADTHNHNHHHNHDHNHNGGGAHHHHEHGMTPGELVQIIRASDLEESVKSRSVAVIDRLAQVEARAHRVSVDEVHFHELGGLDTIIDVVGAVVGLDLLGVEELYCSPIPVGHGFVDTAHGRLPVPVPAVVGLLEGLPTVPLQVEGETVTPTGAAIAAVLATEFGPMPAMTVTSSGFGAGQKDFPEGANLLRIIVGDRVETQQHAADIQDDRQVLLEANIDDMSPELHGAAMEAVFCAGAVDCWFTPIFMKKNRPAVKLSALAPPQTADAVADAILRNTTSFGIRRTVVGRYCLEREIVQVQTAYGQVSVKLGTRDGELLTAAPEFDDCRRIAQQHQVSVREVYQAAQAEASRLTVPD
jgi:uncharacterized protein (TIGR00299 family) protein